MKRTMSDWQGRDPMDCETINDEDNISIGQFILDIIILLVVTIGSFYLYSFLISNV